MVSTLAENVEDRILTGQIYFDLDILNYLSKDNAHKGYIDTLSRLYPNENNWLSQRKFIDLLSMKNQITAFWVIGDKIIATGQGILLPAEPNWQVIGGNMATLEEFGRRGYGGLVLKLLMLQAQDKWGRNRVLNFTLTNNKNKGNSKFYTNRGWVEISTSVYIYKG